jgi:flagellar biosynthesis protein FlhB
MKKILKIAFVVFFICFWISVFLSSLDYETVSIFDIFTSWQDILTVVLMALAITIIMMMLFGIVKRVFKYIRKLKGNVNNN